MLLACENTRSAGGSTLDRYNGYARWSTGAARALTGVLRPGDVDGLVKNARCWALLTLDPSGPHAGDMVDLELEARAADLAWAVAALDRAVASPAGTGGRLVVAVTNVYLHHREPFHETDWHAAAGLQAGEPVRLVLPLVVVDELDDAKRADRSRKVSRDGDEKLSSRARTTLRQMERLFADPGAGRLSPRTGTAEPARDVNVGLLLDPPGHRREERADNEIVRRSLVLQYLTGRPVVVVILDSGMRLRAQSAGLAVARS